MVELDLKQICDIARFDFAAFARFVFPVLQPGVEFEPNWHIECLPYEALLITPEGARPIGYLVESMYSGNVLSFNHKEQRTEWKKVTARMRNNGQLLYEMVCSTGEKISLTGNHPVWANGEYIEASKIKDGDCLLRALQDGIQESSMVKNAILRDGLFRSGKCYVRSITKSLRIPAKTYNIEVEGNNNYFANGILTHNCIAEHLEAMERGELPRLIINLPPRSLKSYLVSQAFPAWVLGRTPSEKFINISYGASVVEQNAINCRRIINSPFYKICFPALKMGILDRNIHFQTDQGGHYYADTALSTVTGIGCFVAGTMIQTDNGLIPIEELHQSQYNYTSVQSYCHETNSIRYNKIVGFHEKEAKNIIKIKTTSGFEFECTPNHPIFIRGVGYIPAEKVNIGDGVFSDAGIALRLLRRKNTKKPPAHKKPQIHLLLPFACARAYANQICEIMRKMPESNEKRNARKILLSAMRALLSKIARYDMSILPRVIQTPLKPFAMLFKKVCSDTPFEAYAGNRKPQIQRWEKQQFGIYAYEGAGIGKGWLSLRHMRLVRGEENSKLPIEELSKTHESGNPPYRRGYEKQFSGEPNNALPPMSYDTSQVISDTVSSVTRISGEPVKVYDLTIERDHNFFANGVLIKNCNYMVLDDLLKPMEALSDTIRNSTNENMRATLLNRFDDRRIGKLLMVMQRLHVDDPTGNLLKDKGITLLKLPGETKTRIHVSLKTPKRMMEWDMPENSLLFPARLSREALDQLRIDMTEYHYCTPAETPILMADLSTKRISDVNAGDKVMGFTAGHWQYGAKLERRKLTPSTVQRITCRRADVIKITLDSGKTIRCTPDHKWFTGRGNRSRNEKHRKLYAAAKIGSQLSRVCDPFLPELKTENEFRMERVLSIEPDGYEPVYSLTTETGNYIAWGLASSNCGQILQEPVPIGGGEFKDNWVKYYEGGAIRPASMNIAILCDPSGGEEINKKKRKTSDWTAFMVVGMAPDHNYYLLDIIRDRLNPTERIDMLFTLHRKWVALSGKVPKVGYEKYGMMTDTHYIKDKQKKEGYMFPLIELGGKMMKEERIRRLIPDMQQERWYFPANLIYVDNDGRRFDLVSELVNSEMATFPKGRFDDMLDGLSRIYDPEMSMIFPRLQPKIDQNIIRTGESQSASSWMDY